MSRHAPVRWTYCVVGWVFVGLGIAGTILPVMPGFVFFILALWAFRNGSPALEAMLLNNRTIGPRLRDWDTHHRIPVKVKWIAISCIVLFGGSSTARMMYDKELHRVNFARTIAVPPSDPQWEFSVWWVQIPLVLLMAYGVWFIARAKSK